MTPRIFIEPLEARIAPAAVASIDVTTLDGTNGLRADGTGAQHYAGTSVSGAGDINGDGFDDFIFAESLTPTQNREGRAFVVFGKAGGFPPVLDPLTLDGSNGFEISGLTSSGPVLGPGVARGGDINNDNYDDVLVSGAGAAFVIFGKATGFSETIPLSSLDGTNGFGFYDPNNFSIESAASAGDINDDGFDDVIFRASADAYVVFGKAGGFDALINLTTLNASDGFVIDIASDSVFQPVVSGLGDMNGDGIDDVVIGSMSESQNGAPSDVYVLFGQAAPFGSSFPTSALNGTNGFRLRSEQFPPIGHSVAGAGDINGDGFKDLITSGIVVFGGEEFPALLMTASLDGSQGFRFGPSFSPERGVAPAGDFNHDGFDDFLTADSGNSVVSLVFGKGEPFAADEDFSSLDGTDGLTIVMPEAGRTARGYPIESAGDVNGDGVDDVILGSPDADGGGTDSGAAYVVFGLAPSIRVTDATIMEGNAGSQSLSFTVSLSGVLDQAVSVSVASADGTAVAAEDYDALPATTLTFAAGETSKTVAIAVRGDAKFEVNETFTLNLSNATGATISDAQGVGTITNDDARPSLAISDVSLPEPVEGDALATLTVSLSNPSSETVSVTAGTADGTAVAPGDYATLAAMVVSFAPGELSKTISVPVHPDAISEGDETFSVVLSGETNATLGDGTGQVTILNVQPPPEITVADIAVAEGDAANVPAIFTVMLSAPSSSVVTVQYALADGTARAPGDYLPLEPGVLTFQPGETTKSIAAQTTGNTRDNEDVRTFSLELSAPTGATLGDTSATASILDNDAPPSFAITDAAVTEGNNATTFATFTVSLSAPSGRGASVLFSTAAGTATEGADFTAVSGAVVEFAAGETSKTVSIAVGGDVLSEPDETFFVNLSGAVNTVIADAQGAGTILDNDQAPSLSIADLRLAEGPDGGVKVAAFTVSLSAPSGQDASVSFATEDGTALAGSDYFAVDAGTLVIPAGALQGTVLVPIFGDGDVEQTEQFFVTLSNAVGATIGDGIATGTIVNDDVTLLNAHTATFTDEDGDLVTVRLTGGKLSGGDFTLVPGSSTIGARLANLEITAKPGAVLTISAQPQDGIGGDGAARVDRIDAVGSNLARVKVHGHLGQIDAGTRSGPALGKLDVRTLGVPASEAPADAPESLLNGGLGKLRVRDDFRGARLVAAGIDAGFGRIQIEGDATTNGAAGAGIFARGSIGAVEIGGQILGSADAPFLVVARGADALNGVPVTAIRAVSVAGDVGFAQILAGADLQQGNVNANVQIGRIVVEGAWRSSSVAAGIDPGFDFLFGTGDDSSFSGGSSTISRIAKITIKGSVFGTDTLNDHFGFVAEELGKLKIAGSRIPLTPGAHNDVEGTLLGATGDVRAREIAS